MRLDPRKELGPVPDQRVLVKKRGRSAHNGGVLPGHPDAEIFTIATSTSGGGRAGGVDGSASTMTILLAADVGPSVIGSSICEHRRGRRRHAGYRGPPWDAQVPTHSRLALLELRALLPASYYVVRYHWPAIYFLAPDFADAAIRHRQHKRWVGDQDIYEVWSVDLVQPSSGLQVADMMHDRFIGFAVSNWQLLSIGRISTIGEAKVRGYEGRGLEAWRMRMCLIFDAPNADDLQSCRLIACLIYFG